MTLQQNVAAELTGDLRRYVARRLPPAVVDDVVQDILVRVVERIDSLRDEERLGPWVMRIARSVVVDHLRKARPRDASLAAEPRGDEASDDELNEVVSSWLPAMLEDLPEMYREAVRLADVEGLSSRELAARFGVSVSGAKSRVQRGRRMLAARLDRCCRVEIDKRGNVLDWQQRAASSCCDAGC